MTAWIDQFFFWTFLHFYNLKKNHNFVKKSINKEQVGSVSLSECKTAAARVVMLLQC